jgi:hypothetical protein
MAPRVAVMPKPVRSVDADEASGNPAQLNPRKDPRKHHLLRLPLQHNNRNRIDRQGAKATVVDAGRGVATGVDPIGRRRPSHPQMPRHQSQ